jgi:flavin-dependent dehydrogenase
MHHPITGIAGAGLAGLATAIGLAQAGQPVEIFEAAPDSGWERKGTWDAVENWTTEADFTDLLDRWKINRNFEYRPIRNFEVYDPQGDCHTISTPRPLLYLVKRGAQPGALEHSLKEQAIDCGVTIHYNERRNRQDVDVWAAGAQHRGQFMGAGLQFQTHHPDTVKLLISSSYAPKAYAYLFIIDGKGVLSVILTRNFTNARTYLQRCLEFFRLVIPLDMENVRLISGFGGRRVDFWQSETTPLRVGEAAGFQDYLWGFGIRYALHSGYLAAQAITQDTDYYQAIHTQIHPLVYTSLLNRAVYNRAGDRVYRFLIEWFARSPQLVELLRERYHASMPKQLLWLLRRVQPDVPAHGGRR